MQRLDVKFSNGRAFSFSAEFLRIRSPSADTQRMDVHGHERVS